MPANAYWRVTACTVSSNQTLEVANDTIGSYFDTAIESLYRHWPAIPSFTHFSIIQDLPPRSTRPSTAVNSASASLSNSIADISIDPSTSDDDRASGHSTPPTSVSSESPVEPRGYSGHGPFPYISDNMKYTKPKHFAQPIVFFDIKCLARFGSSPAAANLTHLRLRVPSRDLARILIGSQGAYGRITTLFPSLRYLDISTTNVRLDSVLSSLLRSYARLEHLVLDRVNLFGFTARDKGAELCKELGGMCVSAGLARGKERERLIAAWELVDRTRLAQVEAERRRSRVRDVTEAEEGDDSGGEGDGEDAETIIAIRQAEMAEQERQQQIALSRARRGHRSAAQSTFSLRDRPVRNRAAASSSAGSSPNPVPAPDSLYLVLPPLPTLKTVSIGGEAHNLGLTKVAEWENEFHAGWREGLAKVLGWASHVADKYERAKRKAEDWLAQETKQAQSTSKTTGKLKSRTSITGNGPKPPTEILLFRYPTPEEESTREDSSDPTLGLIRIYPEGRDYLEPYKLAIADAELHANNHSNPPLCILCTMPDCEGPARRGAEGERVDGRGGMSGKHSAGCGHLIGRKTWGWGAV